MIARVESQMRHFGRAAAAALWIIGCIALAAATWFGLLAAALAFTAARYEVAPDCATRPAATSDCLAGLYAIVSTASRHNYGLIVVTEVILDAGGHPLSGNIVDPPWGAAQLVPQHTVAATSWEGRLSAVELTGSIHHTWQNPYTAWRLLTWLGAACALFGIPVTVAYLTRVNIRRQPALEPQKPWTQRLDTLGIVVFFIMALAVTSIPSSAGRFVLLAIGWAGLSVFLVTAVRGTALAWLEAPERTVRTPREFAMVTASRIVLGALLVAFIMTSAANVARYALT
jgi:hypothetical protein